jgi:plastocyanin
MLANGKKVRLGAIASVLILSTLLASFLSISLASAHGTPTPRTWHAEVSNESQNHAIQGMAFLPGALWINVGDTVVWTTRGSDIHTVTFIPPGTTLPPFNPADPLQNSPQPKVPVPYDGKSYFNSGLMSAFPGIGLPTSYTLTFGVTGDFTYYCLVHPSMIAIIHVRPAGTPYPFSQLEYNQQISSGNQTILNDGQKLADRARDQSNSHNVTAGIGDGLASLMRFFPQNIVIHVGDTVTFTNRDVMEPHTVSFSVGGTFPPTPPGTDFVPFGNPGAFDGSTDLNSGFIGANPGWFGTTYKVTFVKAGTYAFFCDLHEFLGMVATIVVKP